MSSTHSVPPVWKSVEVDCGRDEAFAQLTLRPTDWWPENHRLGRGREAVVFEPFVGGRWYERYSDGSERDWGRILEWVPGHRVTLSWLIDGRFAPIDDDALASRIRIVLTELGPDRTLASIGHVELHRHGGDAAAIRSHLEGPSPGDTLAGFAHTLDRGARPEFPFVRTCPFAAPAEYDEIRRTGRPVEVPLRPGGRAWLLTRDDQVREALKDPRLSNDRGAPGFPSPIPIPDEFKVGGSLLGMDPPEHGPARKLVAGEFTHKRVQAMRPMVERNVERAITDMLDGPNPADLHQALGVRITMDTITELLGLEDLDRGFMHARTKVMFGGQSTADERRRAVTELNGHFVDIARAKAEHPRDDVISRLVARWPEPKDWAEIGNMVRLLLNGGHDSTASMISLGTLTFLQHPDQLKLLADDPALAEPAVEEMLRFLGVTDLTTARVATEDVEIDGVTIRAGEGVYPTTAAANRDPAAHDRPDELDITRGARGHLAFGNGRHLCLGMDLARLELQLTYTTLFRRAPELALAVPFEEIRYRQGGLVFGVDSLPVTW